MVGVTTVVLRSGFPGNVAQFTGHREAFGLDTDTKRFVRLLFQPLLVVLALEVTEARSVLAARMVDRR